MQSDLFNPHMRGRLTSIESIKRFVLAGNATITIRSQATGTRFTYKITTPKDDKGRIWFVKLLTGADNEHSFQYIGHIRSQDLGYSHGRRSRIRSSSTGAVAFAWMWNAVRSNRSQPLNQLDVWHEGRCGRCGRKLTVPESIESGFGPECINFIR